MSGTWSPQDGLRGSMSAEWGVAWTQHSKEQGQDATRRSQGRVAALQASTDRVAVLPPCRWAQQELNVQPDSRFTNLSTRAPSILASWALTHQRL